MNDFALVDELAVRTTLARYCHRCDDGDFDGLVALFTPDGVFTYGGRTARGTAELRAFFEASQGRPEQRGKHLTVNSVVEPGDGRARSVSDFVYLRPAGPVLVPKMTGRYHDDLVKLDGQWLFARRDVLAMVLTGASAPGRSPA